MAESIQKKPSVRRIILLDEVRGFCILCMIIYHALVIADRFFSYQIAGTLWHALSYIQPLYVLAFLLISGISCRLSHSNLQRGLKLAGISILISVLTVPVLHAFSFSGAEDLFGILHCLAANILLFAVVSSLWPRVSAAAQKLKRRRLSNDVPLANESSASTGNASGSRLAKYGIFLCAVLFIITSFFFPISNAETNRFFWLGIHSADFFSVDYYPLLPWSFPFFLGTFLGISVKEGRTPAWAYPSRVKAFAFVGRHALLFYLVHAPLLYLLFYSVSALT